MRALEGEGETAEALADHPLLAQAHACINRACSSYAAPTPCKKPAQFPHGPGIRMGEQARNISTTLRCS